MESISERFSRFIELGEEIDTQLYRLEELEAAVGDIGPAAAGTVGHAKGGHADRTAYLVVKIDEMRNRVQELMEQESRQRPELNDLLYAKTAGRYILTPAERVVVQSRCFDRLPWWQVENVLGYTGRGCRMVYARAMKKLDGLGNEQEV